MSVDPELALPTMRRVEVGFRTKVRGVLIHATGFARRDRDLIETALDPQGSGIARVRNIPDPSGDIVGASDDQILSIVEESLASFSQSKYRLTNPADHDALGEGAELGLETNSRHVHWGLTGAAFLLDLIPYRHSDAAQILGWRSLALGQALALTSENDVGTMYRAGFALAVDVLTCPSCQGRMRLLAVIKEPANVARYLAGVGEATEVPRRSPGRGPPHWKSRVLRGPTCRRPSTSSASRRGRRNSGRAPSPSPIRAGWKGTKNFCARCC